MEAGPTPRILSIDAGTSSVRCLAVTVAGEVAAIARREFSQHYPHPGWVEHRADEIWEKIHETIVEILHSPNVDAAEIAGIGITNQRETVVAWNRSTGEPVRPAIVWQDRRTAARCRELKEAGVEDMVRRTTGLVLDPYFSGTKIEWLLSPDGGGIEVTDDLAFGTIDSWLTYKLTGGRDHVTDASNASRYLLYDINTGDWSDEMLELFGVPQHTLPRVVDSSGVIGACDPTAAAGLTAPVAGLGGDQQSALFGQACYEAGMTKNTYGTGSFVVINAGTTVPEVSESVLSTIAWRIGGVTTYALEGSIFVTGAAIKWLRDQLGVIDAAEEAGPLAESLSDSDGVMFVPAFQGLGAPVWNPNARAGIFGLSRGHTRAHLVRAVVEAMAYQSRDVIDAMARVLGTRPKELRVDGGASVMDFLCRFQADQLGIDVIRPTNLETTAMGAAYLAGLATGVWASLDEIGGQWREERRFVPDVDRDAANVAYGRWQEAVRRVEAFSTA